MDDEREIKRLYRDMYAAMVKKDMKTLDRVYADDLTLVHMTGMRQDKRSYLEAIADGTMNYFSEETESLDVRVNGEKARLVGRSRVSAAVFGGGRHTWRLALAFELEKRNGSWVFIKARASTY